MVRDLVTLVKHSSTFTCPRFCLHCCLKRYKIYKKIGRAFDFCTLHSAFSACSYCSMGRTNITSSGSDTPSNLMNPLKRNDMMHLSLPQRTGDCLVPVCDQDTEVRVPGHRHQYRQYYPRHLWSVRLFDPRLLVVLSLVPSCPRGVIC